VITLNDGVGYVQICFVFHIKHGFPASSAIKTKKNYLLFKAKGNWNRFSSWCRAYCSEFS